jgi:hypothetical protein
MLGPALPLKKCYLITQSPSLLWPDSGRYTLHRNGIYGAVTEIHLIRSLIADMTTKLRRMP